MPSTLCHDKLFYFIFINASLDASSKKNQRKKKTTTEEKKKTNTFIWRLLAFAIEMSKRNEDKVLEKIANGSKSPEEEEEEKKRDSKIRRKKKIIVTEMKKKLERERGQERERR